MLLLSYVFPAMMSLPRIPALSAAGSRPAWWTTIEALFDLTKPKPGFMSVLTAMLAYGAARPAAGAGSALITFAGISLAAAGSLAFNQWWEHQQDAQMDRTRNRPLPRGLVTPGVALAWSLGLAASGVGLLAGWVNLASAGIAAAIILIYDGAYTPMKRRTRWATEVGAVSGALLPLLGSAAAGDPWAAPGLALAAVLLVWQMPHFYAIGWRYRADYRRAGFKLLPVVDPTGTKTAGWSLFYAALLLPVSLAPWALGWLGAIYGVTAAVTGVGFLACAGRFMSPADRDPAARRLFYASIIYLPILLGALALDRLVGP